MDRYKIISDLCKDKIVLDIGSVGDIKHNLNHKDKWLFHRIRNVAKSIMGIDLNPAIISLKKEGYNIIYGDAETFISKNKYEIITAGELIEHLNNPGLFIENMKKLLIKNGQLILTTPNAYSFNNLLRGLTGTINILKEHTVLFNDSTIKRLLQNYNMEFTIIYSSEEGNGVKGFIMRITTKIFKRLAETMIIKARVIT